MPTQTGLGLLIALLLTFTAEAAAEPAEKVTLIASADAGLEGRADLQANNNGAETRAVVGQNDAEDPTDRSRALFRFNLSERREFTIVDDGILTLYAQSISARLYGYCFNLYKLPAENTNWVEGFGRHPEPGKHVEGVAWSRKTGTRDHPMPWKDTDKGFMDGLALVQSLKYGPGNDVAPGNPFVFTIPKEMLNQAFREGTISFVLTSDVEGQPIRADASFVTKEHEAVRLHPRLSFGRGEVLYNGIRLPLDWPPRLNGMDREVMPVPYLDDPPAVIPVDVGRQLFVDDFLIAETTLSRTFHVAKYYADNPVLEPDQPWETRGHAATLVYSDGVWYDPTDSLFKVWYQAPYSLPRATCHAVSKDGIHWEKPAFDIVAGTNIVLPDPEGLFRDSVTVWLDHQAKEPARRWKLWRSIIEQKTVDGHRQMRKWLTLHFSPDGIHWTHVADSPQVGDRTTAFYNPFRKLWVLSLRTGYPDVGRARDYREHPDAMAGITWDASEQYKWTAADKLDPHNPNPRFANIPPQLYNLDCVAYESILLGVFSIWQGDPRKHEPPLPRKRNELLVGFSRDGFHWHRPCRERFVGVNETPGAWNWGNVQSVGGCCLVVGPKLYFYVSGRGVSERMGASYVSAGLATLRRDGFASMDAASDTGTLTTRPIRFDGKHLFVNLDAPDGELRVEVLDEQGQTIEPFTRANCVPRATDTTMAEVKWEGADDLSTVSDRTVRLRFHLQNGSLYSFWMSDNATGASGGYIAAGGPGFTGSVDTAGNAAYRAAEHIVTVSDHAANGN